MDSATRVSYNYNLPQAVGSLMFVAEFPFKFISLFFFLVVYVFSCDDK
jgi:hypothetical protein